MKKAQHSNTQKLNYPARSGTWTDRVGCVASLVDALVCLAMLFLTSGAPAVDRLGVILIDAIACIIIYSALYRRLDDTRPIWAEIGFYLLISGTLFLACRNVLEESASLNLLTRNYSTANEFDIALEALVAFTLPFGMAIYAWLIASSPRLRRWLGFLLGVQVVLLLIALGSFAFPRLRDFVSSELFAVYAIVLAVAKAAWFFSPVAGSRYVGSLKND
ncbi:MAG TPA: hypothetical protein VE641_11070 [Chthoniobacterales bacterium]|nr:hypothetical protein [Chthoniobacterales bacterium]